MLLIPALPATAGATPTGRGAEIWDPETVALGGNSYLTIGGTVLGRDACGNGQLGGRYWVPGIVHQIGGLTGACITADLMPSGPGAWASNIKDIWAPSVIYNSQVGKWTLYYAAVKNGTADQECIGVATATSATGPYTNQAEWACPTNGRWNLDPNVIASGGSYYVAYRDDNIAPAMHSGLSIVRLSNGSVFADWTTRKSLLVSTSVPWSHINSGQNAGYNIIENPLVAIFGGVVYVFFSGNEWNSAAYGTGIAQCSSILPSSPCTLLDSASRPYFGYVGPGGLGPFRSLPYNLTGPGGMDIWTDTGGVARVSWHYWIPGEYRRSVDGRLNYSPSSGFTVSPPRPAANDNNGDAYSDMLFLNHDAVGTNAYTAPGTPSGLGGFSVLSGYGASFDPVTTKVTEGDFNNDGYVDAFFINTNAVGTNAYIAYGGPSGLGGFSVVPGYGASFNPASTKMTSADINGDGFADVLFINTNAVGTNAYIAYGGPSGLGGFSVVPGYTGAFPPASTRITSGDINGDSYGDVFFINTNGVGTNAYIAYGGSSGLGGFSVVPGYGGAFPPATSKVVAGDITGDHRADLFFINSNAVGVNAYLAYGGVGGPTGFSVVSGYTGAFDPANTKLVAGDLNGDEKSDVFFINTNGAGTNAYQAFGNASTLGGFTVVPGYGAAFAPASTRLPGDDT